jgi:hypothetical protein
MVENITELYCLIDDFCNVVDNMLIKKEKCDKKPTRVPGISHPEIITILILYQKSGYKNFKSCYLNHLKLS